MSNLNKDWVPGFGTIFTWFAMDKFGKISVMVNNCWGDIPKSLLHIEDIDNQLNDIGEYMWGESKKYNEYPEDKKGGFYLDYYSAWLYGKETTKEEMIEQLENEYSRYGNYAEAHPAINRGFFEYFAIEGNKEGEDYPVGYSGKTKMGDYYRFLAPTIHASIEDFPKELRHLIAVSSTLDFTSDRVINNMDINFCFPSCYL